ncbi:MAG: hypothetical protein U0271_38285 [Polyangiaceae bacterium]
MASCEFCGSERFAYDQCRRCGAVRGEAARPRSWFVARALLARLWTRKQLRAEASATPMELTRLFAELLEETSSDPATFHEELFGRDAIEDLSIEVDELAADLTSLEEQAPSRVTLEGGASVEAPSAWSPREDVVRPLEESLHPRGDVARTLPGDRPCAAIWSEGGALAFAPVGAVQILFAPDGESIFVLFDHWLERRAWPSAERLLRCPLGAIHGYATRLTLSPRGRYAAVSITHSSRPGGTVVFIDLSATPPTVITSADHDHTAGPVVFGEDDQVYAFTHIDPEWPAQAERERQKADPWKVDFGGVSIGRIAGLGAGSWALYGAIPSPDAPTDGPVGLPVFKPDHVAELTLPTGETIALEYKSLFRTFAPNPKEYPEVVRHRVRPRERSGAELAVESAPWAPKVPFAAAWTSHENEVLVATANRVERRAFPSGRVLGCGFLTVFGGWPTELVVSDSGRAAAVVWHRPAEFASGVELIDLRTQDPIQLFGRGRRFVYWMKRMQPNLIGPLAFGPDDQLAFTATFGGFWYDPSIDAVARRPLAGFLHVLAVFEGSSRSFHLSYTKDLPSDHDHNPDPDRPLAVVFSKPRAVEVTLPHGEVVERVWDETTTTKSLEAPYPNMIEPLEPIEGASERALVRVDGSGVLGRFAVPGVEREITATSADVHPSSQYVILQFRDTGAPLSCAVFDTQSGACVHTSNREGERAIAMAWSVGRPVRNSRTSRDLAVLTQTRLLSFTLPAKERASFDLGPSQSPRSLSVNPSWQFAYVTLLDPKTSELTVRGVSLAESSAFLEMTSSTLTEGLRASAFSPDGLVWAAFIPTLSPENVSGRAHVGDLLQSRLGTNEFAIEPISLTTDLAGSAISTAQVLLQWTSETGGVLALEGVGHVQFERFHQG